MYGLLIVILVLDSIFLAVVILLQAGKGGGLAAMGGGSSATEGILAGRQATTVLTRATWTAGGLFMLLALVLSIMSSRAQQPQSILRQPAQPAAPTGAAPAPVLPGTEPAPAGGAAPTTPATGGATGAPAPSGP